MCKTLKQLFLLLIISVPLQLRAQIFPKEGSILNYRIVGFAFSASQTSGKENKYKIEIAEGNHTNVDSFKKHIIKSLLTNKKKIIAEVPAFGSAYTWRITNDAHAISLKNEQLHHFRTDTFQGV